MHGPGRIVLVRLGIANAHHNAIAEILRDRSVESGHDPRTTGVVGLHDVAEVFGIETGCERRRADEFTEQHGELSAFSSGAWRGRSGYLRNGDCLLDGGRTRVGGVIMQCMDRLQHNASWSDRQAEFVQIILGQVLQLAKINLVRSESLGVLRKTQSFEPSSYSGHLRCRLWNARRLDQKASGNDALNVAA